MTAELQVMSARAVKSAVSAVAQEFLRAHGCEVTFDFAPVGQIEAKIVGGALCDVVILSSSATTTMAAAGHIVADSVRELGRTSIGVSVRAGAAPPDIATPDAFRALLLAARSIALSDPAVGGTAARYLPQLFDRMQIADRLEGKLLRCSSGGDVAERVARGESEIGLTFISEMLPNPGVSVVGQLPTAYANDTVYCAAVHARSRKSGAARALIGALGDPGAGEIWRAAGFSRRVGGDDPR